MSDNGVIGLGPVHCLVYGESGTGKSTFAATFPSPILVLSFDPLGKDIPYRRLGVARQGPPTPEGVSTIVVGTPMGELAAQIELYHDLDPEHPTAYAQFRLRMHRLGPQEGFASVVIDSVTFMELAARMEQKYRINPTSREPRQWFAGSTDALEMMLAGTLGGLPLHVCVLAHVDEDKDELNGAFVRNPAAPGRMRKRLPAGYSELYHSYVKVDDKAHLYCLQTANDGIWNASSQLHVPNPCRPDFAELAARL